MNNRDSVYECCPNSESDFITLKEWLLSQDLIKRKFANMDLLISSEAEWDNRRHERQFAYTVRGSHAVYVARAIEALPLKARAAVLLHECGHISQNLFKGDECEVQVDAWCVGIAPSYTYEDVSYFWEGQHRVAKNLQVVGPDFLREVYGGTE